jgi:GTP cyclohydrolase II
MDTVDANRALNLPDDSREYSAVANMLRDMDVKSIKCVRLPPSPRVQ